MVIETRKGVEGKSALGVKHGSLYDYSTEILELQTVDILDAKSVS